MHLLKTLIFTSMKAKSIIIALSLGIFCQLSAQDEIKAINAKLTEATVFLVGAELTHTATTSLVKGDNELKFDKLSPNIDRNSLKIRASNGVIVSSFEFSANDELVKKPNEGRLKELRDSIELINIQLEKLKSESKIDNELTKLMKKGVDSNISDTIQIADLIKVMEYYQTKSSEIENRQLTNQNKQKKLETLISELNQRLRDANKQEYEKTGTLRIRCSAPMPLSAATFTLSYYTPAAKWTPYYDINVASTDKPIKIISKAKVSQNTTVDWKNVKLTLSTTTPSNGKVAPLFSTWFVQYYQKPIPRPVPVVQNSYSYDSKEMAAVNYESMDIQKVGAVRVRGASSLSQNAEPLYVVDGIPMDNINDIPSEQIATIEVLQDAGATAIYGSRGANGVILVTTQTGKAKEASISDYVISEETALSQTFNIELPYSIPGDGKEQSIELKINEIASEFKYYSAPKLDPAVYLLAEIGGWEKLNLLSGKANITYDGTYVGETFINAASTQEKLALTLGVDKRVTVKRELLKEFSSSKFVSGDVRQVFAYKITVRNSQNKPVKMVLKEQYPKSINKEIEAVWLKNETTPAPTVHKEETGVVTWEEEFKAGETKEYRFSYSLKFPKGKEVR